MELVSSICRPGELVALLKFKMGSSSKMSTESGCMRESLKQCYSFLDKTSRSFAAVIKALDEEPRNAVCIFYLVLRALDTVEDDMSIPLQVKIPMLKNFHKNLYDPKWNFTESTEKDKMVLEEFPIISAEFRSLSKVYQDVICEICQKMGEGMTVFLDKSPATLTQWDEYCHYVAGLVGIGLSKLFSASELESQDLGNKTELSNSMGLFLQKTNIIRDYLEDVEQKREFWPEEVWKKYCSSLEELKEQEKHTDAVSCLNELITNALHHIPDCIAYMSKLKNQTVFNFCALPQVMAIATLERCYNNHNVFTGVVKIRKGEAVKLMMEATDIDKIKAIMATYVQKIQSRIPETDPNAALTKLAVSTALKACKTDVTYSISSPYIPLYMSFGMLMYAIVWHYWNSLGSTVGLLFGST